MKRLIQFVVILSSVFVFLFLRETYKEKEVSDLYNHFGYIGNKKIFLEFEGEMTGFDEALFIDRVYQYCNSFDVNILWETSDYERQEFQEYIASRFSLQELYGLYGDTSEKLSDRNVSVCVTNRKNAPKRFLSLNSDWDIQFYSFNQFSTSLMKEGTYLFVEILFDGQSKDGRSVANEMIEQYREYGLTEIPVSQAQFDYKSEAHKNIGMVLVFLLAILAVLIVFYLSDQMRSISIFKLFGYDGFRVLWKLLGKELVAAFMGMIAVSAVLYWLLVGFVTPNTQEFIRSLVLGNGLIVIGVLAVLFIYIVLVQSVSLPKILKGKNLNKVFAFSSYVLKLALSLIVIPMMISHFAPLRECAEKYASIQKYAEKLENTYCIPSYTTNYMYLQNVYVGRPDTTTDPAYLKEIALVNTFVEAGAYYAAPDYVSIYPDNILTIIVNENYLMHEYPDGKEKEEIEGAVSSGKTVLVISEKYKDVIDTFVRNYGSAIKPDIVMASETKLQLISFRNAESAEAALIVPNDYPVYNKTIYSYYYMSGFTKEKIESILDQHGMSGMFIYHTLQNASQTRYIRNMLWKEILYVLSLLMLLVVEAYTFFVTYRNANREKIAVETLHGYRFWELYWDYLLEALLVYAPLLILLRSDGKNILIVAIVTELICLIPVLIKTKSAGLVNMLKKEDSLV